MGNGILSRYGLERWLTVLLFLILVIYAFALPIYLIPSHYPRSYNEGWNAYYAAAAMHGVGLYPPVDSMMANNYPPLSFYLVGIVGKAVGDYIVAGRLVSLLSLAVVAYNIFRLCRWTGAAKNLALLGAGAFLLEIAMCTPLYIAMDDPQFLAHAFVTSGALIFLNARPGQFLTRMSLAAVLVVAGGLVKHNVLSLPLAFCAWAAVYDRKRLYSFLLALFTIGSLALGALYGIWGRLIVDNVLLHARVTSLHRAVQISEFALPRIILLVVLTIIGCVRSRFSGKALFVAAYCLCAATVSFWMLTGEGVVLNIAYDFMMAIAIGTTAFVGTFDDEKKFYSGKAWISLRNGALLTAFFSLMILYISYPKQRSFYSISVETLKHAQEWSTTVNDLAQIKGPAACEMLSICYWATKDQEIDFFNYGQKIKTGHLSDAEFRSKIASHYYRFIQIELWKGNPTSRLPMETMEQLFLKYQPVKLIAKDEGMVLVPSPQ
jgi:hypothetical protein